MLPSASSQALPRLTDSDMPRTESTSALSQWNGDIPVRRSLRTPNKEKVASSANGSDSRSYAQLPDHNTSTQTFSMTNLSPLSQRVSFGSPSISTQSHSRRAPIPQSSSLTSISPFASSPGRRHQPIYFGAGTSPRRPSQHSPYRSPIAASNSIDDSKRRKFESSSNAAIPVQFASPSSTSQSRLDASMKDSMPTRKQAAPGSSQRADDALRSIRAAVDVQVQKPESPTQFETSSPPSSSSAPAPRSTRAASTMLSVLESSSPRIHTPPVPEVVNPYQTRSKASPKPATPKSTRAKALEAARHRASSSLSSSTARDTDAPPSASLLDMVQRTAPLSPSIEKHRSSLAQSTDHDPSFASQNSAESLEPPKIAWQHKPKRPSPLAMSEQSNDSHKTASTDSPEPSQFSSSKPSNTAFQFGKSQSSMNIASDVVSKENSSNNASSTMSQTSPITKAPQQQVSSAPADSSHSSAKSAETFSFSSAQKQKEDSGVQAEKVNKDTLPKTQQFSFSMQANVPSKQAGQEPSPFLFKPKPAATPTAPSTQASATEAPALTSDAATVSKDQDSAPSSSDLPWLHILPPSHQRQSLSNEAAAKAAASDYEQLPTFAFNVAPALPVSLEQHTDHRRTWDSSSSAASTETLQDSQKGHFAHSKQAVTQTFKDPCQDAAKEESSSQSFHPSAAQDKPSTSLAFSFSQPNTGKPAGFAFGQASTPSSDTAATGNFSSKPLSGFSFRPPASSQPSSGFSFKKPQEESSVSEPKPSFSFLTPTTTSATPSSTQPKFSFGNASKAPLAFAPSASALSTSASSEPTTETVQSEAQQTDAPGSPPPSTSQDKASDENTLTSSGQGEEEEETKHEVRAKIWKLDQGKWQDLGITVFRLKYNPSFSKTRVLARNAVNGNVVLNFNLYAGMKITCEKTIVSFVGMIDAKPCSLRCKVKTNQAADALTQAFNSHLP
ncbi:hypothetical protein MPSI1_003136 [Malassezia psittaci]|uniref:RanBD1 domain-containing protein n=1 Tax=Malassezia psittaci TaxID=1821823 RepID=A0AAF0FH51_9BASI|nr:hypothetical protein MPSI1_003136 [Malassezia psittaci]